MATVNDVLHALGERYPFARAARWDKVGLQIGSAHAAVRKVLVAHEVTEEVLTAAAGYDVLVVYHPLIFRPLENLDFRGHTARLAASCIGQGIHLIAVHTALDHAPPPHALGDSLAQSLQLQDVSIVAADGHEILFKITVFTPPEALEKVSEAMWEAGAGYIGNYDRASFRARGTGTFRPLEGANPYSGELGKLEEADEWRLEVIVPQKNKAAVIQAMLGAHPYEVVAYDVYQLENRGESYGSARAGELEREMPLEDYAAIVAQSLQPPSVRLVTAKPTVSKIACVPGSGASFLEAAARAGCDCLVTGDIKHHDALMAKALGISIIDVTHTATERAAVPLMAKALHGLDAVVDTCEIDTNPFSGH